MRSNFTRLTSPVGEGYVTALVFVFLCLLWWILAEIKCEKFDNDWMTHLGLFFLYFLHHCEIIKTQFAGVGINLL